jgi:hypothetical protein
VFSWLKPEQRQQRRMVRLDRTYLEKRSRRFLEIYLKAADARKPDFYQVIKEASLQCYPAQAALLSPELADGEIANAASIAALNIVLERSRLMKDDPTADFVTDSYATVGVAYHRAAGVYTMDKDMQELGTAAVHLLTIATSYMSAQETDK